MPIHELIAGMSLNKGKGSYKEEIQSETAIKQVLEAVPILAHAMYQQGPALNRYSMAYNIVYFCLGALCRFTKRLQT